MPKTYPSHIKEQAKTYVVMLNMTPEEISAIMEPSANTISRWAEEESWFELQELRNGSTLRVGLEALHNINLIYKKAREENRAVTTSESDLQVKQRKLMEGLNKELGFLSNAIEAVGRFMEFVREQDEELFKQMTEPSMEFVNKLYRELSDG